MAIQNKLYKSIAISVGSSYIFYAINFIGQLVLARLLMPENFGVVALVLAVLGMIDLVVGFSIPMAYIQERETDTLFESAYTLSFVIGLLPIVIAILIYYPLSIYYNPEIAMFALLVSFSKPFTALGSIIISHVEKNMHFGKSYLLRGIALSSALGIAIIMAYNGFEENSLIAREVLGGVFLFLIAKYYFRQKVSFNYKIQEIKSLMKYSIKMIFSRGAELAYFKIPILLIGSLYSTATLGLFVQAFYLVSLTSTALNPITEKVAFVFYSDAKNKNSDSKKDFNTVTFITLIVALPVSLILFFYPEEVLRLLYGEKWIGASEYLKYLALFGLLLPIFNNLKSYFYSHGLNKYVTISYVVSLVVASVCIFIDKIELLFGISIAFGLVVLYVKKH